MRSELKFSMPAKPPWMLKAPFFDLRTVYGALPPQMPTEFWPLMKPTLRDVLRDGVDVAGLERDLAADGHALVRESASVPCDQM